jgi:hypothetical protein
LTAIRNVPLAQFYPLWHWTKLAVRVQYAGHRVLVCVMHQTKSVSILDRPPRPEGPRGVRATPTSVQRDLQINLCRRDLPGSVDAIMGRNVEAAEGGYHLQGRLLEKREGR